MGHWRGVGCLAAGLLFAAIGLTVLGAGTGGLGVGAFGAQTETFTRIECNEQRVAKGGSAWHCFGESPEQAAANDESARRATLPWIVANPDQRDRPPVQRQRTRITFAAPDGRTDPDQITATRMAPFGDRWIAHSAGVRSAGSLLLVVGVGLAAAGTWLLGRGRPRGAAIARPVSR
ncbi:MULTISPECIES: hypothetical protein [unclassified Solwaraspora]|uniref:hypothetical protein n=1 Tax=unclassified Solwaraspora TaxID=2627926 RepID=UPI00259BDED5|nr:hypothetical protein [Solwaraspora sp. WMMA2056]WJK42836.1 hypothetical protein O7608_10865 [Solwaraspora sp. WMMA2056]